MFTILLIFIAILLYYYYFVKPQCYWSERNVKQGFPIPILGDQLKVSIALESMTEMVRNCYNKFKDDRYFGLYQTTLPTLVLRDPDLIKRISVKDFDHFVDHRQFVPEEAEPAWSKNLFSLKGDKWRAMRSTLSPTFTASKMRAMFTLMENSARQYVNFYLEANESVIELELKDSFSRFANDVIANCAFGVTVDSLKEPENPFYLHGRKLTDQQGIWKYIKFMLNVAAPKVANYLKLSTFPKKSTNFFETLFKDAMRLREDQHIVRPDMINLLMEARKGRLKHDDCSDHKDVGFATVEESDVGKKERPSIDALEMTDDDLSAQVLIFFFAGFETIATVMSFMCYELAVHPEIQTKLRKEVDSTYKECKGKLTYDFLNKMKYLDMVTTESLRKYPAISAIDRICTKDYTIEPERPGETPLDLKPGDVLWLPINGLHYDEKYYSNPDKFEPERFSEENKSNLTPYTYLPFGSGPRSCIGSRFALLEMKTLLFHILSKFELTVIRKTRIPAKLARDRFMPYIKGGFWVGLHRRTNLETL